MRYHQQKLYGDKRAIWKIAKKEEKKEIKSLTERLINRNTDQKKEKRIKIGIIMHYKLKKIFSLNNKLHKRKQKEKEGKKKGREGIKWQ